MKKAPNLPHDSSPVIHKPANVRTTPIDEIEKAQKMVATENARRLHRANAELAGFLKAHGVVIAGEPYYDDGKTRVRIFLKLAE